MPITITSSGELIANASVTFATAMFFIITFFLKLGLLATGITLGVIFLLAIFGLWLIHNLSDQSTNTQQDSAPKKTMPNSKLSKNKKSLCINS